MKQLSCITLTIVFGMSTQLAYAQTQSYPTDEELQRLMPDFRRQVEYWSGSDRVIEQFNAAGCIEDLSSEGTYYYLALKLASNSKILRL